LTFCLIADLLSADVSLDSLLEKASKQALADVPQFGRRKPLSTDLIFAELVGDHRFRAAKPYKNAVIPTAHINGRGESSHSPSLPESIYGQKRQDPTRLYSNRCRIADIVGEAIMHFEPANMFQSDQGSEVDPFDELLGIARSSKPTQTSIPSLSPSQIVDVKLEFDDATIDTEAASAYLARFRYHVEYPGQLVLGL
jgi:hypothetical protein